MFLKQWKLNINYILWDFFKKISSYVEYEEESGIVEKLRTRHAEQAERKGRVQLVQVPQ